MEKECELIRKGYAKRVGDDFVINGRTYGHHEIGSGVRCLYPKEGPGFHKLSKGEFAVFKLFNDMKLDKKNGGKHSPKVKRCNI